MEEKETMGVVPEEMQSATAEGVKEAISLTPKPEYREYGEDMAERREGRRVIRMEGGRTKLVLSSEAEEYRDTDGNWQDTDNTLEYRAAEEDDFAGYETKGNRYRVRLPENAKNAILMRVQEGESRLDIRLKERCRTANGALASRKGKVVNYERSVGEKGRKCGEIGYREIFEKTDVRYNLEGGKIKESIVVKERRESYRYEFCIETTQAELVREETGAILIKHGEEQLFRIPEAFMEDANGEVSNAVAYELEEESAGHYHFAIVADAEWMNAEERAFPVLIDPTLIKETGVTLRCVGRTTKTKYNAAGVACGTETVYATESVNKVGKSGNTVYRSYVNFDLGSVATQDILDAKLMLKLSNEEEPELYFFCARATQSTQNTVDFVNKTAAKDTFSYKLIWGNNLQAEMDITSIVRDWRNGESNFGIVLYADETVDGILTLTNATLQITCQSQRSKASSSFQKNDVRRAGSSAVDLYAGRLLFEHKDFEFMSESMPMNIAHVYNSDYRSEEVSGSMKLGKGWRLNFQQCMEAMEFSGYSQDSEHTAYVYTDGCGVQHEAVRRYYEIKSGDTQYDSSERRFKQYIEEPTSVSAFDYLTKEGLHYETDNYVHQLHDNSGGFIDFDEPNGQIALLNGFCRNGKKLWISSGSWYKIVTVTDGADKVATFDYNGSGYLVSISCEGKKISYKYSGDKLIKIEYPDGTCTEFRYSGDQLVRVKDRSGYQLVYSYSAEGKVISVREEVDNTIIGSTVTKALCPQSGDCWDIEYLHPLQTQVKNRNGLVVEYIFDHDGNTITVSEAEQSVSDYDKQSLCGTAAYRKEIKIKGDSSSSYITKKQVIEATLHHQTNLLGPIETWKKLGTTSADGPSTVCYVEGGKSMKLTGALQGTKILQYTITNKISKQGVYVFGCWAKAENSLASVDREYVGSDGRYFGILLTLVHGTGNAKSYYYASFDPHNTGWQQAVIVADLGNVSYTQCYLEAIYSHNEGDVYFDHAFGALTDGAIANTYDNNYSETRYHGYTVTTLYDSLMHVVKSCTKRNSDENYFATTYNYSAANRLDSTVDPNGIETVNDANDENANILEKTTRKGNLKLRETSEYDDGDYLIRSVNTNGSETTFDYNTDGSLKSATLPSEQTISYAYNNMGQLLSLTANVNGKLNTNSITYKYGYVTRLRHGSTTYDFTYDGYGRVRTVKAGGTTVLTNTYTDFGTNLDGVAGAVSRVVSKDALGNTVTAYADKYGRVIASKKNNEELTKEVYDLAGNLTQHIDNELGVSYNYTYNEHNQVTEYTEKKGTTTRVRASCTYDTYYRPMTSTYTVNGKSYSYSCGYANSLGDELSSFTTPLGVVTYTRDDLKRLKSQRYTCKNVSALQSYTYAPNRADGTYTSQLVKNLNFTVGSNVQRLSYTYDASGNITAIEDNAGAVASYEYDGLGRLTRENIAGKKTVEYHYDSAGNLTSKKEYAYTTGNLGAIKATHSYQYASGTWGDRLAFYDGACITYNAAGYPTCYRGNALTWSNGNLTKYGNLTFAYNDAGIRIKKGTTEYIVKDDLILAEKRGDTVIHYYYDDSGVAGFEYNGQKYFYRKNLQGDIIGIYDSCWNLLGQYEYDAWGNLLSQIGSEILKINPFRYRGYYCDTESGIYYLNSRYYDPVIGRFISPDSLKYLDPKAYNGLNLYAYCRNNPVMGYDPEGTLDWGGFWKTVLGVAIGIGLAAVTVAAVIASGGALLVPVMAGFAIGASTSLIGQGIGNLASGRNFFEGISVGSVLMGGLAGAAFATGVGGLWGTVAIGAAANMGTAAIENKSWANIGLSAVVGGIAAGFGYGAGKFLSNTIFKNGRVGFKDLFELGKLDGNTFRAAFEALRGSYVTLLPSITPGISRGVLKFLGNLGIGWL